MNTAEEKRKKQEEALREKDEKAEKEKEFQKRISSLGLCPMEFVWIRQTDGYRCAGGSHFLTFDQIMKGDFDSLCDY